MPTEYRQLIALLVALVALVVIGAIYHHNNVPHRIAAIPTLPVTAPAPSSALSWYTDSVFGNWKVRCRSGATQANKKALCVGVIDVLDKAHQRVVLLWIIGRNGKGGLTMNLQTPTGVIVASGVGLKLDDEPQPRALPYQSCDQQSCSVVFAMDQKLVAALRQAKRTDITLHTTVGKDVSFHIPMSGTDKLLSKLE